MKPFQNDFVHLIVCIEGFSMAFHDLLAHFFSVLNNIPLTRYTTVFLIHSPTEGRFHALSIMNRTVINVNCAGFCVDISFTDSMDINLSKCREVVDSLACCSPWSHKELGTT